MSDNCYGCKNDGHSLCIFNLSICCYYDRNGHRKHAGKMIADLLESGDTNFNHIHKEVLLFDKEDLRPFREISARKKPYDNLKVSFMAYVTVRGQTKSVDLTWNDVSF